METQSFGEGYCWIVAFVLSGRVCDEVCSVGFGKNWNQLLRQGGTVLLVQEHCLSDAPQNRKERGTIGEEGASFFVLLHLCSFLLVPPNGEILMPTCDLQYRVQGSTSRAQCGRVGWDLRYKNSVTSMAAIPLLGACLC